MKKVIFILVLFLFTACGNTTVETVDGQEVQVDVDNADEWCAEGSTWSTFGAQGSANMVVVGLVKEGKYEGYCHVTYNVEAEGMDADVDFYFTEDGAGYQVMDVNGEKYESEWTG